MNRLFLAGFFLLFFTATSFAADPVTIELVHISGGKPLPDAITQDTNAPRGVNPDCKLTFLVTGTNLARLKPETLKLQVLKSKAGKNLLTINGKPSFLEPSPSENQTFDGRYGIFTLELEASLFPELGQLEIVGNIQVQVGEGLDKFESQPFATAQKQDFKLGDFPVRILGEKAVDPLFKVRSDTGTGTDAKSKNLAISLRGDEEKIASIRVVRKDKVLPAVSKAWQDNVIDYEFVLEDQNSKLPVKLELATWKNLRTVTVPFQVNAPKK